MTSPTTLDALQTTIAKHWGFRELRPLQADAMQAVLTRRDSLVVMPTGGGKSLCYQAPAAHMHNETTIVVSPLIALMRDQVESLRAVGVSAAHLDSAQSVEDRRVVEHLLRNGRLRLLFVSPERLTVPGFQQQLRDCNVRAFAIDEAHCISHWGHDFRPPYRQLDGLREVFPHASFHAYTATATPEVRRDICARLGLRDPLVLVGSFDRPNLIYRVLPRVQVLDQVLEVLDRHKDEAGIIYCIRRQDVDDLSVQLQSRGFRALPYHAGLDSEVRRSTQEAFRAEVCDIVVATVAFGMGIDRPNVRFVLHTGMPKSIEHYQQEAGRAGRDSLEAEAILLYSGADFLTWRSVLEKSASENEVDPEFLPSALQHLEQMIRYCRAASCRHRLLVEHFGEKYEYANCKACDLCLNEVVWEPEGMVIAQKILSCVARVGERFGVNHVVQVLRGAKEERILRLGHDKLSTFRLLADHPASQIRDWILQLIGQGVLMQTTDKYPILKLNELSWQVMKKTFEVRLLRTVKRAKAKKAKVQETSWEGVDKGLFDALRSWRRRIAEENDWPPYIVLSDAVLREISRTIPRKLEDLRNISGIGESKLRNFGQGILDTITAFLRAVEP